MALPPAIIFINDVGGLDFLTTLHTNDSPDPSTISNLVKQLFIDDIMFKSEFDARVAAEPYYPTIVHLRGLRIMVILPTLQDGYNRQYADVVLFVHQGMADIEFNRFASKADHRWDNDSDGYCGAPTPCGQDRDRDHDRNVAPSQFHRATIEYNRGQKQNCGCGDDDWDDEHERDWDDEDEDHEVHFKNYYGPPGQSYDIQRLNIYELLRVNHCPGDIDLPWGIGMSCCNCCRYPFYCDGCHNFSGMKTCRRCGQDSCCGCNCGLVDNQGVRGSPVHEPNCENEAHNPAFIFRK
jgi:hypothetical protein